MHGLEVDVVTEVWPREVLEEVDVMLFLSRWTSDLAALVGSVLKDVRCTEEVKPGCARWR